METYLKYFQLYEFDSPDAPGSGSRMDVHFLYLLDIARWRAGIPFVINSGYRTKEHNKKVRGHSDSLHMLGRAVDINTTDSLERFMITEALIAVGLDDIGIYPEHIHVPFKNSTEPGIWLG